MPHHTLPPYPVVQQTTEHGSCLVTGGLGALGSLTGAWLLKKEAWHVVLLGRSARCDWRQVWRTLTAQ